MHVSSSDLIIFACLTCRDLFAWRFYSLFLLFSKEIITEADISNFNWLEFDVLKLAITKILCQNQSVGINCTKEYTGLYYISKQTNQ